MKEYTFKATMTKGLLKGMIIKQTITHENNKSFKDWVSGVNKNNKKGKCNFFVTPTNYDKEDIMRKFSRKRFIRNNRKEIDRVIKAIAGNCGRINDRERESWLFNDEGLYTWAIDNNINMDE